MAREMKDSGVAWIGKIPMGWNEKRLKYLAVYNDRTLDESTDDDYLFDYVDIGSVEYGKGIIQYQRMRFHDAPSRARRIVKADDVIISTVRTYLKAVASIPDHDNDIVVSTGFLVLRAIKDEILPSFLKYAVLSDALISMVEASSVGISYPAINASDVVNFTIPVPPLPEQSRIAVFLDSRCAEIDRVIAATQSTIEEYKKLKQSIITEAVTRGVRGSRKMKDSGVEWIGEIPEEWECIYLKYVTAFQEGPGIMGNDFRDEGIPLIRIAGVKGDYVTQEGCNYLDPDMVSQKWSHFKLHLDDVVISASASTGIAAIVQEDCVGCIPYTGLIRFPTNERMSVHFLRYYLLSEAYNEQINIQKTGSTIQHYGPTHINRVRIALPSREEQTEIAAFLDYRCSELDRLIESKQRLLTELESYKKSVIYEYVTGKKEAPDTQDWI